eukprot:CAMPEP_0197685582 /NCGR_PEP_ID=MMETSP1338-20131121/101141_1 /TAXON_ID=43686 ORGANISM="Pelagodinium beii, Strain RCC1491" /NCGR_SAMPLE_ID=MMETSP1338 /ASSEMBLY_ACC=CAM_ASM_000754 /LENGTH=178 /DNA_ID=CAMNT_0043267419 /DNA_START=321 /DNA_END=858 /DNA_ORIENTATION=+
MACQRGALRALAAPSLGEPQPSLACWGGKLDASRNLHASFEGKLDVFAEHVAADSQDFFYAAKSMQLGALIAPRSDKGPHGEKKAKRSHSRVDVEAESCLGIEPSFHMHDWPVANLATSPVAAETPPGHAFCQLVGPGLLQTLLARSLSQDPLLQPFTLNLGKTASDEITPKGGRQLL